MTRLSEDLASLIFSYNQATSPAQTLFLAVRDKKNASVDDAVDFVWSIVYTYAGREQKARQPAKRGQPPKTVRYSRYNRVAVTNFIKGTRKTPQALEHVFVVYLFLVLGEQDMAQTLARLLGVEFTGVTVRSVMRTFKTKRGSLGRVNNAHFMPTNKRGALKNFEHIVDHNF